MPDGVVPLPNDDNFGVATSLSRPPLSRTVQVAGNKLSMASRSTPDGNECGIYSHALAAAQHLGMLADFVTLEKKIERMDLATIPTNADGSTNSAGPECSLDPAPKLKSVTRSWCPGSCESFPPISLGEAFNWEYSGRV